MFEVFRNKLFGSHSSKEVSPDFIEVLTPYCASLVALTEYNPELVIRYPYSNEHLSDIRKFIKNSVFDVVDIVTRQGNQSILGDKNRVIEYKEGRLVSSKVLNETLIAFEGISRLQLDSVINSYFIDLANAKDLKELSSVRIKHEKLKSLKLFNMLNEV